MSRKAARTASIFNRVDLETREQAGAIQNPLDIPMPNTIGMFPRQAIIECGIPFEVKLPASGPVAAGSLYKEQFDVELERGMDDLVAGRVIPADVVEAKIRRLYEQRT